MILSHKCSGGPSIHFIRNICIHPVLECNHYKVLGLSPSASQAEIKSAYYELSKRHHPDKNQGSEESVKLFRDITAAYEVLGNEKSRQKYDTEQFFVKKHETQIRQSPKYRPDFNDEVERLYYMRRRSSKIYYGKTSFYDFDAWYKAHYVTPKFTSHETGDGRFVKIKFHPVNSVKEKVSVWKKYLRLTISIYLISWLSYMMLSVKRNKKK